MENTYIFAIAFLLPLTAIMVILQTNPYNALILRGILGAVAALVYALLGAADVALTEAFMGTLLAITLYAIALRSSMVVRLGVVSTNAQNPLVVNILHQFREIFDRYHLRTELTAYEDMPTMMASYDNREVHGIILPKNQEAFITKIRIARLYEILQLKLGDRPEISQEIINESLSKN